MIVQSTAAVTLVGGGPISKVLLGNALLRAPKLVAADSGADRALRLGQVPDVVIGDFDSVSKKARNLLGADRLFPILEQHSTDFDKALRNIMAPFVLALGFAGARIDHGLAVFNTLVQRRSAVPCIVLGAQDIVFHAPRDITLRLHRGDRVSLFPMNGVAGHSDGLEWPIAGLQFHPAGQIGTSNRAVTSRVRLQFDGDGMLVILPRARLDAVLAALVPGYAPPPVRDE